MRYVIIGGSIAGVSAVKAIRESDPSAQVVVVTGERPRPYYRPMIPLLAAGQKSESDIRYPEDPLEGRNISVILGTVLGVDTKKREALLASGNCLLYDRLLIATGGAPIKPRIPGLDGTNVHPLRRMDQALRIRDEAATARSAVIIGGGLVGIKAALALRERSTGSGPLDVAVIETLPEILNGRLDGKGAAIIRDAVERKGIAVHRNANVTRVVRTGSSVSAVKLSSGVMLRTDLVVVAAGVRPGIAFLKGSGIRTHKGVLVDGSLRTSVPGVYAAGDVVEGTELLTGRPALSGLWTNAAEMGRVAGMNMAGMNVRYPGFLSVMNASEIAGVPFVSAGMIEPKGRGYSIATEGADKNYWKLVIGGNQLVGAVFVGDISRAGLYVNLIKNRVPLREAKEKVARRRAGYADFVA